jgi:endogenous inhibitor of DNA gyrase (YacG/DUF329 family)
VPSKLIVNCPTCSAPVPWGPEQRWRPFCSERCRLIDLGTWADETNRIAGEPDEFPDPLSESADPSKSDPDEMP